MKSTSFAFFAYLGCILVAALENAMISDINEQGHQVIELFENERPLRLRKIRGSKGTWNSRFNKDSNMDYFENYPGVDYFRKDDYEFFFPKNYPQDNQWVEEITQKGEVTTQLVKRQASKVIEDEIKEEHVLVLIVKSDYKDEAKCKKKLEEYCKRLLEIYQDLGNENDKVRKICEDGKQEKCKGLKQKVEKEINELKAKLDELLKKSIDNKNCRKYEDICIFLEDVDQKDVKDKCSELRDRCYKKMRQEVSKEIIFRAFGRKINSDTEIINIACSFFIEYVDELIFICINTSKIFIDFKKNSLDICKLLQTGFEDNELMEKCEEYLKKCYFYGSNCKNTKCDKIKDQCKEKGILYEPELDYDPVKSLSFSDKIELEDLYEEAEAKGIIFRKQEKVSFKDTFFFRSSFHIQEQKEILQKTILYNQENKSKAEENCKEILKKCYIFKSIFLNNMCKKIENKKCKEIVDVEEKCTYLKLKLYLKGWSTEFEKNKSSKLFSWKELPRSFSREDCIGFVSECFYLEKICKDEIGNACKNVRVACYKKGQDRMLNRYFGSGLKNLRYLNSTGKKSECQKLVRDKCKKVNRNIRYMQKCLEPEELCLEILDNIFAESKELGRVLDDAQDFPEKKECVKLKKKCDDLKSNSDLNDEKCTALDRYCEYLRVINELRKDFLKRNNDVLENQNNCKKALKEKCDRLIRRQNSFNFFCVLLEETCEFMVKWTKKECSQLRASFINNGSWITDKNKNKHLQENCLLWDSHCQQLMESCPEFLKHPLGNTPKHCLLLKEKCNSFWEELQFKEKLMYNLKGSLDRSIKCKETLEKYCTKWEGEKNQIFDSACKDKNGLSDYLKREEICNELVKKVIEKCPTLKSNLEKAKIDLEKKKDKFERDKEEAENCIKQTRLLLLRPNEDGQGAPSSVQNNSALAPATPSAGPLVPDIATRSSSTQDIRTNTTEVRHVRRTFVDGEISEAETKALDATAKALDSYLELKGQCKALQEDCGFKEECPTFKPFCKEIDMLCEGIKPLKLASHHTLIFTTTSTMISITTITTTSTTMATVPTAATLIVMGML
ncbi:hypothetical protein PNEG_02240 [Pneumocystis murina B123]|uniref:Major surface glycoprotein 2 C-terminal domain-containing protein n=1 Tax=Pneumocystis murina (strain B123) TaxID=1069680 RepID=M7NQX1_PNEMU|nr:hypothetical protein PNEG_02240 [Pneumocystis murina B123]EMR09657.1 hypothetical protein PNEG_02240 [Pneumocystis murina B123]